MRYYMQSSNAAAAHTTEILECMCRAYKHTHTRRPLGCAQWPNAIECTKETRAKKRRREKEREREIKRKIEFGSPRAPTERLCTMRRYGAQSTERCLYKYIHKQANERRMTKRRLQLTVKSKIYREHCRETTTNSHVISNTHRSVRVFFFFIYFGFILFLLLFAYYFLSVWLRTIWCLCKTTH